MSTIGTIAIFVGIAGALVGLGFLLTKKFKSRPVKPGTPDITEKEEEDKTRRKVRK